VKTDQRMSFFIPIIFFALALLERILYLIAFSHFPILWGVSATADASYYHSWAQQIAAGNLSPGKIFFIGPLYAYFLSLFYLIFGSSLWVGRLVQALLGAFTVMMVYRTGEKTAGRTIGIIAAVLVLLYGPLVYADGALLPITLVNFLLICALYLLVQPEKLGVWGWLGAGLLLGLAAIDRGNLLLLLPLLLIFFKPIFVNSSAQKAAGRMRWMLALGFLIALLPSTVHNLVVSGEIVPTTDQGGFNFYLGNNPGAQGLMSPAPDMSNDPEKMNAGEAYTFAEREVGHKLGANAMSGFWLGKGLDYLLANPGAAMLLYWRKLVLSLSWLEFPLNESYYFFEGAVTLGGVPILALLPLNFGILLPLAVPGFYWLWREKKGRILPAFFIFYLISLLPFFLNSRFRMPMVLPLFIPAGITVAKIWREVRNWVGGNHPALLPDNKAAFTSIILLTVAMAVFANLSPFALMGAAPPLQGDTHVGYNRMYSRLGSISYDNGDYASALDYYSSALAEDPATYDSLFGLGQVLATSTVTDRTFTDVNGIADWSRAAQAELKMVKSATNASEKQIHRQRAGLELAIELWSRAAALHHWNPTPLIQTGNAEMALGRPLNAETAFRKALQLAPDNNYALDGLKAAQQAQVSK
jgi:4-amino-4-deoxy-L-arabinose transferase-like glycosyltransferase